MNRKPQQQQGHTPDLNLMAESMERGAQAAKFLSNSEYAEQAFKLAAEKEKTKQLEL